MRQGKAIVVDGDGHVCEPADLWTSRLPAHLRERGIRLSWNAETGFDEAYVEDRLITDRGLVGLGNAGTSFADLGRGVHYEDISRAGFDPRERLAVLDAEGIDAAVLLRAGASADLVLFDLSRLAAGRTLLLRDFPGASSRFVVEAQGYKALIVNGAVVLENGEYTGALPGRVLRGGE